MSSQLARKFDIAIPVESFFIPHFERYAGLFSILGRGDSRLLAQAVQDYLEISLYAGTRSPAPQSMLLNSLLSTIYRQRATLSNCHGYSEFLNELFRLYAEEQGASRWGEKGMNYELERLERYDRCLNHMKVLHIVRDGRDVALSWMREWFGPKSVAESAMLWRRHVLHYRAWGNQNPDRYFEVRYEDFLARPDSILSAIGMFFELNPIESDAGSTLTDSLRHEVWARNLRRPIMKENSNKWIREMSSRDVALFESIAGDALNRFGYSPATESRYSKLFVRRLQGYVLRLADSNFYRRKIRRHLPLVLIVSRLIAYRFVSFLIDRFVVRGVRVVEVK